MMQVAPVAQDESNDITGADQSGAAERDDVFIQQRSSAKIGALHRAVRHLASGGMGHVFVVEHIHLGAYAAVKLPKPSSQTACRVLEHEARLLSRLQHPHIVSVLDFGQLDDGLPYMLMEYVNGLELDKWLEERGPMPARRAVGILKQLASAVDYMHANDVVHCDIKPANILFDPRAHDFVKLVDFGIARRCSAQTPRRGLIGTPAYMAPEQARGADCGFSVDIYGVAALALEMITGRPPYDCDSPQDTLTKLLTEPPASPSSRGIVQPGLDAVFALGLHSDPKCRYQSASEFVEALESVLSAESARKAAIQSDARRGVGSHSSVRARRSAHAARRRAVVRRRLQLRVRRLFANGFALLSILWRGSTRMV
jgi:serine/threonine protein kinase